MNLEDMVARSSLEEMLKSLQRRDEEPKDVLSALPSRPRSRGRLPSARRWLPVNFKVEFGQEKESEEKSAVFNGGVFGAGTLSSSMEKESEEKAAVFAGGMFGDKRVAKVLDEDDVFDSPSVVSDPFIRIYEKLRFGENENFVSKKKLEGIKEEKSPQKTHGCKKDVSSSGYRRRGQSLYPSKIALNSRSGLPNKLHEIKEKKMRQSLSVSPRSQKLSIETMSELRKGISTISAMKSVNSEDSIVGGLKPKNLFQESKNPIFCKKPLKNAKVRIVASRYCLACDSNEPENKRRKWSLPEP